MYPDIEALTKVLTKVLLRKTTSHATVQILDRWKFREGSTFPVEIVSCRMPDGRNLSVFCKYEAGRSHQGHGHRGGLRYEADVYEKILSPSRCSAPAFLGRHYRRSTGDTWLFLESLDGKSIANTHRLNTTVALSAVARWIGRFHASFALHARPFSNIKRYDARYYRGFVNRAIEFSKGRRRQSPWLIAVCRRADEFISELLRAEPTIIHGEFYPGNILYKGRRVCPVDWESAAVAPGELDLASLTEGWSPDLRARLEGAYMAARWPDRTPAEFTRTLTAARLYWAFRWLGDTQQRFDSHKSGARLAQLFEEAQRWPLI